jgi:hypothetical protein
MINEDIVFVSSWGILQANTLVDDFRLNEIVDETLNIWLLMCVIILVLLDIYIYFVILLLQWHLIINLWEVLSFITHYRLLIVRIVGLIISGTLLIHEMIVRDEIWSVAFKDALIIISSTLWRWRDTYIDVKVQIDVQVRYENVVHYLPTITSSCLQLLLNIRRERGLLFSLGWLLRWVQGLREWLLRWAPLHLWKPWWKKVPPDRCLIKLDCRLLVWRLLGC